MKLRIQAIVERVVDVDPKSYGLANFSNQTSPAEAQQMLKIEKDQFDETLQHLLQDPETKVTSTLTMLDANGFPMAETHWEEGGED